MYLLGENIFVRCSFLVVVVSSIFDGFYEVTNTRAFSLILWQKKIMMAKTKTATTDGCLLIWTWCSWADYHYIISLLTFRRAWASLFRDKIVYQAGWTFTQTHKQANYNWNELIQFSSGFEPWMFIEKMKTRETFGFCG